MSLSPNSFDKRQSFRCPVQGPRQAGELRFGEKRLKIQLLDESAGGFCALIEQPTGIVIGAQGLLNVGEDWFNIRVINLEPIKPTPPIDEDDGKPLTMEFFQSSTQSGSATPGECASASPSEIPPTRYRIGLNRVSDAYDPDIRPAFYSLAGLSCHLKQVGPGTAGVIFLGIILAVAVVIVPATSMQILITGSNNEESRGGRGGHPQTAGSHEPSSDAQQSSLLKYFAGSDTGHSSKESKSSFTLDNPLKELQKTIRRLPGAMPFTIPEVVKRLELTDTQQKRIRVLIENATNMIKNLGGILDNKEKSLREKDIFESTRKQVLDLLDDTQKHKWNELTGESGNEEKNK